MMAKATKKAAVKKGGTKPAAGPKKKGNSGKGSVPHTDAPSISLAKDESDYSQL